MKPRKNDRGIKSLFSVIFVTLIILTLLISGCNQAPTKPNPEAPPTPSPKSVPVKPSENENVTPPNSNNVAPSTGFPIIDEVSFPDGAPSINHEAKLIRTVYAKNIPIKNMRVTFSLPEGFVLVSGNLSWQGDIAKGEKVEIITAVVRAVKTGNWTIDIITDIDPRENGFFIGSLEGPSHGAIYVSVSEDSAEWGKYPPWQGPPSPVPPTQSSPAGVTAPR